MRYSQSFLFSVLFLGGCTASTPEKADTRPPMLNDRFVITDEIDTQAVLAAVKPIGYIWNREGQLRDRITEWYDTMRFDPNYPNPFSPSTTIQLSVQRNDSVRVYFCNTQETSCALVVSDFLIAGTYRLGFQRLDVRPGFYVIRLTNSDTTVSRKYFVTSRKP